MLMRIARCIPTIAVIKGMGNMKDNIMIGKFDERVETVSETEMLSETRRGVKILLRIRSTKDLVEDFIMTGFMEMTPEVPIVRGWIMYELQLRNPKAFNAWLDSEDGTDASLRKYFKNLRRVKQ